MTTVNDNEKKAAFNRALRSHGVRLTGGDVSFDRTPEDDALIDQIVERVTKLHAGAGRDFVGQIDTKMDLVAVNANGCPMDFRKLLEAEEFTLWHDLNGIARHLDRGTGELMDHFLPRCAKKEARV